MILKIAWRNIWRNKIRSLVVIIAIALGLWAGVFASAFVVGMMAEKIDSVVQLEMSHYQVHHPKFREEMSTLYYVENGEELLSEFRRDKDVKSSTGRVITMAMIASANFSGATKVVGVDPQAQADIVGLDTKVIEGKYFEGVKRNPILISRRLAEKYKLKVRSKVVLTFQDLNSEMVAAAFRVAGIFETGNGVYDNMNVFVRQDDLSKLLQLKSGYHELAILLNDHDKAESKSLALQEKYPELEVLLWMDLSLGMRMMVEMLDVYTLVLVGIILLALMFSIVNTMLMAVLERGKELGMLMAVGMTKQKVFSMIMLETICLTMLGGPLGLLLSWVSITYFGTNGIDLGASGDMYSDLGFASVIYPALELKSYIQITTMVMVMAVLAAIYPARKALKLNPVEAIRKI